MEPAADFNMEILLQESQTRWLKPIEVLSILQNYGRFKITNKTPQMPPSGSLLLFNRRVNRYFRNDGYIWRRKRNGKSSAEAHEHLKVGTVEVLNCYYAQGEQDRSFQKRIYWMLDPAFDHIVLVHYREVTEGKFVTESILNEDESFSTPNQRTRIQNSEAQGFPSGASESTEPCQNSYSSGSMREVSSRFPMENVEVEHLNMLDSIESHSGSSLPEALRKIEMQLSLEDDKGKDNDPQGQIPSFCIPDEDSPAFLDNEARDSTQDTLEDIFCRLANKDDGHVEETGADIGSRNLDMLKNSGMWSDEFQFLDFLATTPSRIGEEKHWFIIREVSPEWAFCSESTKVIITGDFLSDQCSWAVVFGDVEVPVEIVQEGVIRCQSPRHIAGKVNLYITDGNKNPCSEERAFEFHEKMDISRPNSISAQEKTVKSTEELLLLIEFLQILLGGQISNQFQYQYQLDAENTMDWIVEELLRDKFQQWLSSKCREANEGEASMSKRDKGIIHVISALGYDWALELLLDFGVGVDYRDANGWTALHWAARLGREKMVSVLLAAGASPGAVSDPTSQDPAGKTPASMADANGHKGLAAYLSEAELTSHRYSLDAEESKTYSVSSAPCRAVNRISERTAHLHGGTEDELAVKDSLAAARNSTMAAARIQCAFRAYSLKKKQETAAQSRDFYGLSVEEIHGLSSVTVSHRDHTKIHEKAAVSIQKNYRCWKRRKEFVTLRRHVVKIQARVRAHQARKKYRELLWTVGILEKIVLRWHRRGVGLRGYQPESTPIDEEEEDIVNIFHKKRVQAGLDKAVSRVLSIVDCPEARQQYRRMLDGYQQQRVTPQTKNHPEKQQI